MEWLLLVGLVLAVGRIMYLEGEPTRQAAERRKQQIRERIDAKRERQPPA